MRWLLDRIAAWLGYFPREYARLNNGTDAVARGQRWEMFYAEEGGLRDMFERQRAGYLQKVGSLKPGDVDGLKALGIADRINRELEREVQTIIETGKLREHEARHAANIAAIRR